MSEFAKNFKKVNGFKVLKNYIKNHLFFYSVSMFFLNGKSKKSLELLRLGTNNKIVKKLRKKYKKYIISFKEQHKDYILEENKTKQIWFCWLQGIEQAPPIVKECYDSLVAHIKNANITIITEENYHDYVSFPPHIERKINSGKITKTHLSDLIRLELLEKFGGTWIDATVYCTSDKIPDFLLNSKLFLYQILKPGLDGNAARISSWFITSCPQNPIISLTKELLYEYWSDYNWMKDYFLIHDMFELAIEAYPEIWSEVIPVSSSIPHILLLRLGEKYSYELWQEVLQMTPFHKLSYKFSNEQMIDFEKKDTFYSTIFNI